MNEKQIIERDIPKFAKAFLTQCKSDFDDFEFRFHGYTKRRSQSRFAVADFQ